VFCRFISPRWRLSKLPAGIGIGPVQAEAVQLRTQRRQVQPGDAAVVAEQEKAQAIAAPMAGKHRLRIAEIKRGEIAARLQVIEFEAAGRGFHQRQPAIGREAKEACVRDRGAPRSGPQQFTGLRAPLAMTRRHAGEQPSRARVKNRTRKPLLGEPADELSRSRVVPIQPFVLW